MSTLKHISSTRIARILTMALLALCFLPLAVRSAQSNSITSNAYQTGYQDTSSFRLIDSQWEYYDAATLYKGIPLVGDGKGTYTCYQVGFVGEYRGSLPLEYSFDIYDWSGATRLYSSIYYDSGTLVNVGLPLVQDGEGIIYRCKLYVRLKDGGNINRTDMYAGAWTWYLNRTTEVEEQTLPAEWFETTTQSTGIFIPLTTETTPIDNYTGQQGGTGSDGVQRDIDYYLQFPAVAASFAQFVFTVFGRLFALQYVEGFVCYGLVVATVLFVYDKLGGY